MIEGWKLLCDDEEKRSSFNVLKERNAMLDLYTVSLLTSLGSSLQTSYMIRTRRSTVATVAKVFKASLKPSPEICRVFRTLCKSVSRIGSCHGRLRVQCGALKSSRVPAGAAWAH